jgi:glutamyl-tRNA reductase
MASVSESKGSRAVPTADAETAIARIRERSERIADRECEQAFRRLRNDGSLSEREAEAVAALAERLTDRLLAVPEEALRETSDERMVRVVLELFGD